MNQIEARLCVLSNTHDYLAEKALFFRRVCSVKYVRPTKPFTELLVRLKCIKGADIATTGQRAHERYFVAVDVERMRSQE